MTERIDLVTFLVCLAKFLATSLLQGFCFKPKAFKSSLGYLYAKNSDPVFKHSYSYCRKSKLWIMFGEVDQFAVVDLPQIGKCTVGYLLTY